MFNYYIYRTYFNAKHSFNGDITKIHGHSFTVVTYIGMKDSKEDMVLCQDLVQVKMRNFSPF